MFSPSLQKDLYTSGCTKNNNLMSVQQLKESRILFGAFSFFPSFLFSIEIRPGKVV